MPLPRFQKLDEPRRRSILSAAAAEFSEHGFSAASYNRIIAAAGISKGAMYYYFADKDDLYRTILSEAITLWIAEVGTPVITHDADGFWKECEAVYQRSLRLSLSNPETAALCMSITKARERDGRHAALTELNAVIRQWTEGIVRHGQSIGAIRTDVPTDLLMRLAIATLDAGDQWLLDHWNEMTADRVNETAAMMVGLLRRVGEAPDEVSVEEGTQ